ncbi:flavodoxin family protein [Ruminococcus sp. AF21-11]|nr:flavodoxin family protein [Ruminococcus sp. AF21-11]
MHITRAFLDGMKEAAPQEVHIVNIIDKHIEYYTGCFTCKHNGGECIHNDDMKEPLDEVFESDLLLFSYPLYCYGMPASLKAFADRTMPLSSMVMKKQGDRYVHVGQADFSRLKYMMTCGCGFPNTKQNFEPAVMQFKLMFPNNHTIITVPESPMFNAPEAAEVTVPRFELVKQAGKQYAETGEIDEKLLAEICSPMIPEMCMRVSVIMNLYKQKTATRKDIYTPSPVAVCVVFQMTINADKLNIHNTLISIYHLIVF